MACAEAMTFSCDTDNPQQFHEFHPMGGVSAMVLPTFMVSVALAVPCALVATSVSGYSPRLARLPCITPR